MTFALKVDSGAAEREYLLPDAPGSLRVGSAREADITLPDPQVDLLHLEIEATAAGIRATDLGSRNGTRLNGLLVRQALLRPGDEIRLGNSKLTLVEEDVSEAPVAAPPPHGPARRAPASRPSAPALPAAPPLLSPSRRGRRAGRRRFLWPLGVCGVVAAALVAILLASSGQDERERETRAAYRRAAAARDAGRLDEAERAFTEIIGRWPESREAGDARRSLDDLHRQREEDRRAREQREQDAREARTALAERWTSLTPQAFEVQFETFREEFEGTAAAADESLLEEIFAKYEAEKGVRLAAVKARVARLLAAKRYYDARFLLQEYIHRPTNIPPDVAGAEAEDEKIREATRKAFAAVDTEAARLIDSGSVAEALALLTKHRAVFEGTRHAYALRQRLDLAQILARDVKIAPEEAREEATRRETYLRAGVDAGALARGRRWKAAAKAYERVAEGCPFEDLASEFRAKARVMSDAAALLAELPSQVADRADRFRGIDLGNGLTGNAVKADGESLTLRLRGATSRLPWEGMSTDMIVDVLGRLELEPEGHLRRARLFFDLGALDEAHDAISAALKGRAALRTEAFEILAQARKLPVPAGGFVLHRRRWVTPTEKKAAELADRIAEAEREATSSDARRRKRGLTTLREIGESAQAALVRALTAVRESTIEELLALPVLKDPATKAKLFRELQERRKAALALIFDTTRYPYPHPPGPAYDAVQAEVDQLVGQVRKIWVDPLSFILESNEEARELHERADEASKELTALGSQPAESLEALIGRVNAAIDMPRYGGDGTTKGDIEWNEKCLEYNRRVEIDADEQERACVDELNGYRVMMGRRAVKWSDKLLAACRGHAKEMKEKGYFAHNVPLPGKEYDDHRTPGQRAKNAGYGGGVTENIARGSTDGKATHWQWYGSSGHHRNLLGKGHTEVGVGRFDEFWAQNFGRASRKL